MTDSDSFRIPKALGFMSYFHSRECHSGSSDDKNLRRFGIWIASILGRPFLTTPPECLFLPFRLKTEAYIIRNAVVSYA